MCGGGARRARRGRDRTRGAWVEAEEFAERALRVAHRARLDEYPTTAFVCALAARVALHRGEAQRAHELLARAQRLRLGLTYAIPHLAVQCRLELVRAYLALADAGGAETMLREIEAVLRRQPDLGTLRSEVDELRASLKTVRADAPGASTLTEAELRLLPYITTHLSFREIGERRSRIAQHSEIRGDGRVPQAQGQLPQRRGRTRPRARTGLAVRLERVVQLGEPSCGRSCGRGSRVVG